MLTERQRQVVDMHDRQQKSYAEIGRALGKNRSYIRRVYLAGKAKLDGKAARLDPGVKKVLGDLGMGDLSGQHSGWVHREDPKTGEWASVYFYLGKDGAPSEADLETIMHSAIKKVFRGDLAAPARPAASGENLLVIDIADLHIGKLCVERETGFTYDRTEAVRRGIEGCRRLLQAAKPHGIGHILFVMGNDVIHIDTPRGTTTSGTPQDTDGTLHVMFDDAVSFYVACLDMCREFAPVSVLHCPSNHDWFTGYGVAQTVRAWYRDCPEISVTEYNASQRHRKYFRFGANLLGITHADGAKEADLPSLMVDEVVDHLAAAPHRYWYLHHLHHKIRKQGRGSERRQTEKDLIGMTVMQDTAGLSATSAPQIEYIRSPSPPDGWHDRNGYVNRQGVECFLHCPHDGQFARFTAWF